MEKKEKKVKRENEVEAFLNENYEFRYNEILNRTSYRSKGNKGLFKIMKGYKFNSILREIKNQQITISVQGLKSLLESDFVEKFDPIKSYLKALPNWDDDVDYIEELCSTISTTDDDLFRWAFKKWFVAFIASCLYDGIINHSALIITGKQGIGKTTWLLNLVPKELSEYRYSGKINPNNKDSNLLLTERMLINVDEMASYNKAQVEAYKELITKEVISERRVYGYFTENYVRRASFVGSSNHNEILMDTTGNRRFLVFEATNISYEHKVDISKAYSQALYLIEEGFKHFFDKDDIIKIEKNNQNYLQSSVEEDLIDKYFKLPSLSDSENIVKMNSTEILDFFKGKTKSFSNINNITIGKIMKAKGFPIVKPKGIKRYVIELN